MSISPYRSLADVNPSNAYLWTEFRTQFDVNGVRKCENLGRYPGAPRLLTLGTGVDPATIPAQITGRHGISVDGGDYVNTNLVDPFDYNTPFTLFAAVVPRYTSGANIIMSSEDINNASRGIQIDTNAGTTFRLVMVNSQASSYIMAVSTPLVMGSLATLVATHDGTGVAAGCNLYVNGVLGAKTTLLDTLGGRTVKGGNSFLVGGRRNAASVVDTLGSGSQVLMVGACPFACSPQQVQYLHRQVMTRINAA